MKRYTSARASISTGGKISRSRGCPQYSLYEYNKNDDYPISHAIHAGLISENELEESCRERVQSLINKFFEEKKDNN
jgi:hypothetical protein